MPTIQVRQTGLGPDPNPDASPTLSSPTFIVVITIFCLIITGCLLTTLYLTLRRLRAKDVEPKYIPTAFLKARWHAWAPATSSRYKSTPTTDNDTLSLHTARSRNSSAINPSDPSEEQEGGAGVDRNTSIRSVLTLPAYKFTPRETEQVLGRAGERSGIDVVVSFPETAEEEELHREEEMEAIYQLRLSRQAEAEAREARRQQRREARERGDWELLEELRLESQARARAAAATTAAANSSSTSLVPGGRLAARSDVSLSAGTPAASVRTASRERRVSSVSYGELGVADLNGTRIRSSSTSSDQRPLLSEAASIAEDSSVPRERSRSRSRSLLGGLLPIRPRGHQRNTSSGSGLSISTNGSGTEPFPTLPPPEYEDVELSETAGPEAEEIRARGKAPSYEAVSAVPPRLGSLRVGGSSLPAILISSGSEPSTPTDGQGRNRIAGDGR